MREKIDCFMPCSDINDLEELLQTLRQSKTIQHINLLVNGYSHVFQCEDGKKNIDDLTFINVDNPNASRTLLEVEANTDAEYVLLNLKATPVSLGQHALDRMLRVATDSGAGMVYADSYIQKDGLTEKHPTIDYQKGSIRDDFDFGQLILIRSSLLHDYAAKQQTAESKPTSVRAASDSSTMSIRATVKYRWRWSKPPHATLRRLVQRLTLHTTANPTSANRTSTARLQL